MEKTEVQQLFLQHYAKMLRTARSILYDEQDSKDVVSDIFANLLYSRAVLLPATAEHYLLTSVRNQCLKRLRHEVVKQRMEEEAAAELPSHTDTEDDCLIDIHEFVVSRLTRQEQRIFRLRFTDGCSYEEIAAAEGISRVAVWKHLSHTLNAIRKQFKKQ